MWILQHMTSSCWRSMTSCPRGSQIWCCPTQYQNQCARCKHQPSLRWLNPPYSHSLWTLNYARVNPLPSPATSCSSSRELHLYIESDTSSPSVPVGPPSSSQELLLQGDQRVQQPPPIFATTTNIPTSTSQLPPQPTTISSWAAIAEQSVRSTPETVVRNWAYSGRIRGPRPRFQPMVYPPPVTPTPFSQQPRKPSPRYDPTIPPLRPQLSFPQPTPYDVPTSTDNYPCADPSRWRRTGITAHETCPVRSSPIQGSQSPVRNTGSPQEAHSPPPL